MLVENCGMQQGDNRRRDPDSDGFAHLVFTTTTSVYRKLDYSADVKNDLFCSDT